MYKMNVPYMLGSLGGAVCALSVAAGLATMPAAAHHSFSATFQANARITVKGEVTKVVFKNPHTLIYMDVKSEDGTIREWVAEGPSAISMRRNSWDDDTVEPGDFVSIYGDSTHDGSPMVSLEDIWHVDPQSLEKLEIIQPSGQPFSWVSLAEAEYHELPLTRPDGTPNLSALWANRMPAQTDGARTPPLPYTAAGKARKDIADIRHDHQVFCDAPGLTRQTIQNPYPIEITQYDDRIVIDYEEYAGRREIPLGGSLPQNGVKTRLGDSVARYEGGTLIIETVNFLENMMTTGADYISDEARIIERYSRDDEASVGAVIDIDITVYDPVYLTEPYVVQRRKSILADYAFTEHDCKPPLRDRTVVSQYTSFFLASEGLGDGANLGGLAGADAHCEALADSVNQGGKGWRAFLSTTGEGGVNATDRIGSGPWYNPRGELIAANIDELIAAKSLTKENVVAQNAGYVNARGDTPNKHDILTGTQNDGTALNNGEDTTCSNWTSNSEEGSALVGHYDRTGGGGDPTSWTNAHGSRGCSQANLQSSGGDGLFYCFATENIKAAPLDTKALYPIGTSQSKASNAVQGAVQGAVIDARGADAKGGGKGWLFALGALLLVGFGGLLMRLKKSVKQAS